MYQAPRTGRLDFPTDFPRGRRGGVAAGGTTRWTPAGGECRRHGGGSKICGRFESLGVCTGMQRPPTTAQPPIALTEDRLWRPEKAAWYLDVKTSWVYEAVRAGRLPCHRV